METGNGWKYFSYKTDTRLACPCCGTQGMNDEFMQLLDEVRAEAAFPFVINSGYRCPEYNARVSSTGKTGPHTTGRAVDIRTNSRQRALLFAALAKRNAIKRVGVGAGFTHIDNLTGDDGFEVNLVWNY